MAREYSEKRDLMRARLAHQAARLMAEDGIEDHVYAKRKAARQLGATDTRHMPSNEEIDATLVAYRSLYQPNQHANVVRERRFQALESMRLLAQFRPYLTGSVLSGHAGKNSDINLMVFSDDGKAVLLFLLKHNIDFVDGEWLVRLSGQEVSVPSYTIESNSGALVHIVVLPENARHSGSRHPATHANIAAVEALLASTAADETQADFSQPAASSAK